MNAIKTYLRRRKQSDTVKLITLLCLLLACLLVVFVRGLWRYGKSANARTEYLLTDLTQSGTVQAKLAKISEMDGNVAVGTERQYSVTLDRGEVTVRVRECTAAYLADAYGITDKAFHLSPSAHRLQSNQSTEFTALYQRDDKSLRGSFVLDAKLGDDTPFALKAGSVGAASSGEPIVAAMFKSADVNGTTARALESMGFEISNQSTLQQQAHSRELTLVKLRYDCFLILLTALFVGVLCRYEKNAARAARVKNA